MMDFDSPLAVLGQALYPLNDHGDCLAAKLHPGNGSSADDSEELLAGGIRTLTRSGWCRMLPFNDHQIGSVGSARPFPFDRGTLRYRRSPMVIAASQTLPWLVEGSGYRCRPVLWSSVVRN